MSIISKPAVLQGANIVAFVAMLLVNGLANAGVLNGKTTGEISDQYPTLVTPSGYVFSIWGLIYTLLLIFVVFQALRSQREKPFLRAIGFLFVLSSFVNILWLFLWQYGYITLSVPAMFALLVTLVAVYVRLHIGRFSLPVKEKLTIHLPFSVYLGWITVASMANVATALTAANWDGFGLGDVTWAVVVIIVALIITLGVIVTRSDVAYSFVIVWALAGIVVKQIANQTIVITAGASAIIIVAAAIAVTISKRFK